MPLLAWSWGRGCLLPPSPLGVQNISLADVFSGGFWVCWVVSSCNTTDKVFSDKSSWQVHVWRGIWLSDVRGMQETYHGEAHNSLCVCVSVYIEPTIYILIITKQSYCECIFVINTYSLMHKQSHLKFLVPAMLIFHWKKLICRGGRMKGR